MDLQQTFAFVATVWLAGAAIFALVVLPKCPRIDNDPVEPVSHNLRNPLHTGSDTVA